MHDFTIVILLGLGLWKVVDLLEDLIPSLTRIHSLMTVALGVAAAVALQYSLFTGFHVVVRETWMGQWATGFVIAGTTSAWRALLHWFGSSEGDAPEARHATHRPRSVAA
jgi:hypothetical protein